MKLVITNVLIAWVSLYFFAKSRRPVRLWLVWSWRFRPHYVGGIWKCSFIFTGRPIRYTPILHENGAFLKRSSNLRNLKTSALSFSVDRKHFENGAFRKRWRHDNHVIYYCEWVFLKPDKSKMTGYCCVFKFLRGSMDGKRKISVFKSSGVVWTEKVKSPFLNSSGIVWTGLKS